MLKIHVRIEYTGGAKKCIHILRDVIYVKCVYIFFGTLCIYMYRGCQKMYTHQRVSKNVYTFSEMLSM